MILFVFRFDTGIKFLAQLGGIGLAGVFLFLCKPNIRIRLFGDRIRLKKFNRSTFCVTNGLTTASERNGGWLVSLARLIVSARLFRRAVVDIVVINVADRVALRIAISFRFGIVRTGGLFDRRWGPWRRCRSGRFTRRDAHVAHTLAAYLADGLQEGVAEFGSAIKTKNKRPSTDYYREESTKSAFILLILPVPCI